MNASSVSESYILHILTISLQLFSVTKNSYTIRFGLFQPTFRSYDWNLLASCIISDTLFSIDLNNKSFI